MISEVKSMKMTNSSYLLAISAKNDRYDVVAIHPKHSAETVTKHGNLLVIR